MPGKSRSVEEILNTSPQCRKYHDFNCLWLAIIFLFHCPSLPTVCRAELIKKDQKRVEKRVSAQRMSQHRREPGKLCRTIRAHLRGSYKCIAGCLSRLSVYPTRQREAAKHYPVLKLPTGPVCKAVMLTGQKNEVIISFVPLYNSF